MNWPICTSSLALCRITAESSLGFANRGASAVGCRLVVTRMRKPRRGDQALSRMVRGVELSCLSRALVEVGAKGSRALGCWVACHP